MATTSRRCSEAADAACDCVSRASWVTHDSRETRSGDVHAMACRQAFRRAGLCCGMSRANGTPLRSQIEAAWRDATYPGDDRIATPTYCDEGIVEYFRGR